MQSCIFKSPSNIIAFSNKVEKFNQILKNQLHGLKPPCQCSYRISKLSLDSFLYGAFVISKI